MKSFLRAATPTLWVMLLGCGAAELGDRQPSAHAASSSETETCRAERLATLRAMADSGEAAACHVDADCGLVTNPGHPNEEYDQVVAARDASSLDARATAHLSRCGAFIHHEAIGAFSMIEAECEMGRCVARETVMHIEE